MKRLSKPLVLEILVIFVILVVGLFLRVAFVNHGLPDFENPDEIDFIGPALNLTFNLPEAIKSGNFTSLRVDYFYGHPQGYTNFLFVSLTVFKEIWQLSGKFNAFTKADLFVFSRLVTGFLSAAVPLLMYLLSRRFFSKKSALLALLLGAFSYFFILYSHTASPYSVSTLTNLIFIYFLLAFWDVPNPRNLIVTALSLGLAAAFNFGSVVLLLPLLVVFGDLIRKRKVAIKAAVWVVAEIGLVSAVIFAILSPATLINFQQTLGALKDLSFTQKMGCLGQVTTFRPWHYFFGHSLPNGTLTILNPASFSEALGILPAIFLGLSLIYGLFSGNKRLGLLSLTFLAALVLYSNSSSTALRWLLPFLPFLLITVSVSVTELITNKIVLTALVIILIGPSLFSDRIYLQALSAPDSRETALNWILGNIPKEVGVARPTISAPPIWRYGYEYDRSISHPQCNKPGQPLNEATPSSLESYVCDPRNPQGQVKYFVVSSSVVSGLLSNDTAERYPNLYNGWRSLYDKVYSYELVKEVGALTSVPMTGPTISIYRIPDSFSCRDFTEKYWQNNGL